MDTRPSPADAAADGKHDRHHALGDPQSPEAEARVLQGRWAGARGGMIRGRGHLCVCVCVRVGGGGGGGGGGGSTYGDRRESRNRICFAHMDPQAEGLEPPSAGRGRECSNDGTGSGNSREAKGAEGEGGGGSHEVDVGV